MKRSETPTLAPHTLLVGAGKGGVGKSTVSVNLAAALADMGQRVGLLDADLYGPSIPTMMSLSNLSPQVGEDKRVIPFQKFGVHVLSIGFFLEEGRSVVWRGPMLHKMLEKMLCHVAWPPLDYLLIDLPPGTGDVPLSLKSLVTIEGALLVATPQRVALADVIKSIDAFDQLEIPLVGLVENMTGLVFGEGNVSRLAQRLGIPLIGSLPLDPKICHKCDEGIPSTFQFRDLARNLLKR